MKLLNEDFFDNEEVQSEVQSSVDVNEEDTDLYSHTLKYFCCICLDMDVFDSFVNGLLAIGDILCSGEDYSYKKYHRH